MYMRGTVRRRPASWLVRYLGGIALLGLLACGGSAPEDQALDLGTARGPDGSDTDPSGTSDCGGACTGSQVCSLGQCVALPSSCPCPIGAYCDLTTDECKPGCVANDGCAADSVCDLATHQCRKGCRDDGGCPSGSVCELSQQQCRAGCRGDGDCALGQVCDLDTRACVSGCHVDTDCPNPPDLCSARACKNGVCGRVVANVGQPCASDNNACTVDVCAAGTCTHAPGNEGAACGGSNECSADVCHQGACLTAVNVNAPCASDGNECTTDQCGTTGTCSHDPVALDALQRCGNVTTERALCDAGECYLLNAGCRIRGDGSKQDLFSSVALLSCGCTDGTSFRYQQPGMPVTTVTCLQCQVVPGTSWSSHLCWK